jgi:hypothetical protein
VTASAGDADATADAATASRSHLRAGFREKTIVPQSSRDFPTSRALIKPCGGGFNPGETITTYD